MNPKISIIIPVYNVECYLSKCLKSIIEQSYSKLEIIIIDDGSSDKSSKICDEFAKKDKRILVLHKKNEGVSVARNLGIQLATGEYLMFVDSDDYLPVNSVKILLDNMINNEVQLCCGAWEKILARKDIKNSYDDVLIDCNNIEQLGKYLEIEEVNGPVAKLYITSLIKKNNLRFIPEIKIGEDAIFNYQYIQHCKRVFLVGKIVYVYNKLNNVSATHTYYKDFSKCAYLTAIEEKKCLSRHMKNEELSKEIVKIISKRFMSSIHYIQYYDLNNNEKIKKIEETYQIFKPELNYYEKQINDEIVQRYIELCKNNQYEKILNELDSNKKKQSIIRKWILDILSSIKKKRVYQK